MNQPTPGRPWHLGANVAPSVLQDGRWRVRWSGDDGRPKERTFAHEDWAEAQSVGQDLARDFEPS